MCKNLIYLISFGLVLGVVAGVANAGIIAYWPFDEGSGDVAADVVGGANAQLTDIDWVPDQFGGFAAESSRGSDQILVDPGPTPTTQDLSIAWWMVDNYDSWHTMMNKAEDDSTAGYSILLRPTSEASPLLFRIGGFQAYGGWGVECSAPQGAYNDGEWTHVVCTYDYAADTATIYINGELAPNGNNNPKTGIAGPTGYCEGVNDPTQPLYIVGQRETYGGIVDDVAIWDHALSANEVMSVFTLGPLALDPRMASRPSPSDGATDIPREVVLGWDPGEGATAHNVYLGTVLNDVNDAVLADAVSAGQTVTTYDPPGRLDFGQTYYWRIDEVIAPGDAPIKGTIWSFSTEPVAYPVPAGSITVTASSADADQGPENTINSSGLDADDLHSTEPTDMWTTAPGAPGPAWIQYEFDKVLKLNEMLVWNHNSLLELAVGLGCKDVTIEYSVDGINFTTLGTTHEFAQAPGAAGYAANTTVDFGGAAAKYVKLTVNSNWGGILDQYGLSEVRFLSIPVFAREPSPHSGATDVSVDATFGWRAGREAAKHNVYLSTDEQAVIDGTAPAVTVTEPSHTSSLDLESIYFWRIDEVNDAETPTTWQGEVWNLSTQEYLVVDDFESYNDIWPEDDAEASNLVFFTWADGYLDDTNGSTIGGTEAFQPSMETANVFDGKQAAPLYYDNTTAMYSEVTANVAYLQVGQDWTKHGIKALTLRFSGNPANVAQQLYVKVNGTMVLYDGSAENLKIAAWQMWYIDLASLGVNLANVTELAIGLDRIGALGGQGMILLDGIRLYSRDRQLITPVEPDNAKLEAHWTFDGDALDSSGNGHHGTLMGSPAPVFSPGVLGQALDTTMVDGPGYVEITGYKGILGGNPFSITAWINTSDTSGTLMGWGSTGGGVTRFEFRPDADELRAESSGNVQGLTNLPDNEWIHVAVTARPNARITEPEVTLYLNGRVDNDPSTGANNPLAMEAGYDLTIGRRHTAAERWFDALIDDVRIYNYELSNEEIAWLAGLTVPFDTSF